jgi:hypothetical protein
MSVLDFPSSPTNGQYYGGYVWNAANETWDSSFAPRPATIPVTGYNAIINGAGDIWQRGGAVSVADGQYGADRWRRAANGSGGACAFFQVPNSTADTDATKSPSQFYMRYQWTSAPTSQSFNVLQQCIEDVRTFANQTVTLSFWAKSPTHSSMVIQPRVHQFFGAGGSTDVVVSGSSITITGSWQKYSATFNVPAITGKTIGANSWLGVEFDFFNFLNTTFAFDYTNVQLESGPVPTEFKRNAPSVQAELAACQRYYYRVVSESGFGMISKGTASGATQGYFLVQYPVKMRIAPTSYEASNVAVCRLGTSHVAVTAYSSDNNVSTSEFSGATWTTASGGYTMGDVVVGLGNNSSTSFLGFSAEL